MELDKFHLILFLLFLFSMYYAFLKTKRLYQKELEFLRLREIYRAEKIDKATLQNLKRGAFRNLVIYINYDSDNPNIYQIWENNFLYKDRDNGSEVLSCFNEWADHNARFGLPMIMYDFRKDNYPEKIDIPNPLLEADLVCEGVT